jgi:ABC-2 type transport system permease protein
MRLAEIARHEWKTRLSRPAALMSLALFAMILLYGAFSGRVEREIRVAAIHSHEAEVAVTMARWMADLRALEEKGERSGVPPWAASAMDVTFSSALRPAPLGDFAIGQSDLLPYTGAISLWDPDIRLFSRYELDDPVSLALGTFDLSKAIILILPIVLIVLSFDVLSSDRDTNRLALALAQGATLRTLLWSRLLIRGGVAMGVTWLVEVIAMCLQGSEAWVTGRLAHFALWLGAASLYGFFWIAVIGFVSSRNSRGETNVVVLLLTWTALTLIVPACSAALAETAWPAPSRLAYLAQARETEIEVERSEPEVARRFVNDHPEMVVDDGSQMPAYVRTAFLATAAVDDATRPILADFERSAARRDEMLQALRYLSPATVAHLFFNDITGTSSQRHRRYMAEARRLKAEYAEEAGPYIVAGRRLPAAQLTSLPQFRFHDKSWGTLIGRHTGALVLLASTTALLSLLADRRLRQKPKSA